MNADPYTRGTQFKVNNNKTICSFPSLLDFPNMVISKFNIPRKEDNDNKISIALPATVTWPWFIFFRSFNYKRQKG